MKKFAIALVVLVSIALPIFAAAMNGALDLDGSKAAEKAALLKSWEEAEKAAPQGEVIVGEITVESPVTVIDEVQVVGTVAKAPKVASAKTWSCRTESLKTGGEVKFCSTVDFRVAVDASEGAI